MDKRLLLLSFKFSVLIITCLFFHSGFAKTYYVSTTGNNTGDGSASTPFKTIAKAASVLSPGDTVLVFGGNYSEKNIIPATSGTENAMIVFKPNPGTGDVIISHPATSLNDDTPIFNLSNRSFIWIEGLSFKNFEYGKASIFITNGQGNVLISNRFENIGNSQETSWNGSTMIWVYQSSRNVIRNNYFNNIIGDGISINRSNNNLVLENTFIEFKGKLRGWGGSYLFSRAIDVQDMSNGNNVIAFNYATGVINHIWLDRDGSNNVMLRNIAHNSSSLIFNESRSAHNVIQENIGYNLDIAYHTARYENTGWTFDARWVNNVAYNNKTGFYVHKSHRDEFRNNISFNNRDYNLVFTKEAMGNGPHIFENNLWYTENKPNSIQLGSSAVSVPEFQYIMREKDGLSTNPLFVDINPGSEDFTLQQSSPARNSGDNGVDMGAYAVYGPTAVGWDPDLKITNPLVRFESVISEVERGGQIQLRLILSSALSEQVTVDIIPVAGDARSGEDFQLVNQKVIFEPGETSKTVSITVLGESEHDELVAFRLGNIINAQAGSRNLSLLRINHSPVLRAYAGMNQSTYASIQDGNATIKLDGSRSADSNGTIQSFAWSIGGDHIATGVNPTVSLPPGTHTITLTVTDDQGNIDSDYVVVSVLNSSGIWLEAECGTVGSLWDVEPDDNASRGQYVTIQPGNNSTDGAPADESGHISYTFDVSESGTYSLWARVITPGSNDDSFWLKMDNGSFTSWNGIPSSSSWTWAGYSTTYNLSAGEHTLTIAYREDGAKLDKIWFTSNDSAPSGEGPASGNCGGGGGVLGVSPAQVKNIKVYPNPVQEVLTIPLPGSPSVIYLYNSNGQKLLSLNTSTSELTHDMANYPPGIYFIKVISQGQTFGSKIIKQ